METNPVPMDLKSTTLLTNKSTREEDFKKKNQVHQLQIVLKMMLMYLNFWLRNLPTPWNSW